jgi:cyclopropane-fatty-acyl-phospholipid synthase
MGPHYAHTLRLWRERFVANWRRVRDLGFDDRFFRMWEYYLAYCEAGFRTGYLDVAQFRIERQR